MRSYNDGFPVKFKVKKNENYEIKIMDVLLMQQKNMKWHNRTRKQTTLMYLQISIKMKGERRRKTGSKNAVDVISLWSVPG